VNIEQELQKLSESFVEFKGFSEKAVAEAEKYGKATGEMEAKLTEINSDMAAKEEKISAFVDELKSAKDAREAMEKKIADMETSFAREGEELLDGKKQADKETLGRKAFFKALRSGYDPQAIKGTGILSPEEEKALILGNDTAGGYLAPPEYVMEMIKDVVEWSPIRQLARIRTTSRTEVQIPKRTGVASASWVEETGTRSETDNPSFGMEQLRSHEMYAMTKVSKQELEDSVFNIESFLREEFAEQFGVLEGTGFVSGNGAGQPQGLMSNANVGAVNNGHATVLSADALIALYYELKEAYLNNSQWLMNRSTLKTIRQLKDGNGNYLWAVGIRREAEPPTILDRPYRTAPDMPAISSGTYPIMFGDFRRGYLILDRIVMETMADPITSKATGMIEFSARKRVGGQVIQAEALKKLYMST
jgi:HK97 family phage major capsid protein